MTIAYESTYRNDPYRGHRHVAQPAGVANAAVAGFLSGAISSYRIDSDLRDWEKTSDHVPVMATFDV